MTRAEAYRLRAVVEKAAASLDDKTASEAAVLFPRLKNDGRLIPAGTRINWKGRVRKAAVDLWDMTINNPDAAPNLWPELPYRDGIRIIPVTISVTEAFSKDEEGWWGDELYISLVDDNAYTPAQFPPNWQIKEGA